MKSWMWIASLSIAVVLAVTFWLRQGESELSPAETFNVQSATEPTVRPLVNEELQPQDSVFPEIERLAAPIAQPSAMDEQTVEQLRQEADRLIKQTDELLAAEDLSVPALSDTELADIEQRPEFQVTLERETALEDRLDSLN